MKKKIVGLFALAAVVLGFVVLGLPSMLIIAGAWSIAVLVDRRASRMSGPPAWAAGVVLEFATLSALSFVFAAIHLGINHQYIAILTLCIPIVAAQGMLFYKRHQEPDVSGSERSYTLPLVIGLLVVLTAFELVNGRGANFGITWAMSGDARNHVQIFREILFSGGLTAKELRTYPCLINNLSALISEAGGRAGLNPGLLMLHDARALADTFIVSAMAIAAMYVAALVELLASSRRAFDQSITAYPILLAACLLPLTPMVLGIALNEGFLSGYGALLITVATIVVALRLVREPSPLALVLMAISVVLSFFSWTIMATVPISCIGLVIVTNMFHRSRWVSSLDRAMTWRIAWAIAIGAVAVVVGGVAHYLSTLEQTLAEVGSIVGPNTNILFVVGAVIIIGLLLDLKNPLRIQYVLLICLFAIAVAVSYVLRLLAPQSGAWTYYSIKSLWMFSSSLLWVLLFPIALLLQRFEAGLRHNRHQRLASLSMVPSIGMSLLVILGLNFAVSMPWPLRVAQSGWFEPTVGEISAAAYGGSRGGPFVMWDYQAPGNDRLGNFWAALIWDTYPGGNPITLSTKPNSENAIIWAYYNGPPGLKSLCSFGITVRRMLVITSNPRLETQVRNHCPRVRATFKMFSS